MKGVIVILVFLMLHLLCLCVLTFLVRIRKLTIPGVWLLAAVFLPLWGELAGLACHYMWKTGKGGRRETDVDKRENDGIIENIEAENENRLGVIPLEEALRINDSAVRRTMIMDILNQQPEEYIGLLKEAGSNEDAEVVHYATTAMSELSKDYDLKLQSLEAEYARDPGDINVLEEYVTFLEEYLKKDFAQGQFLTMQRIQYSRLLDRLIAEKGSLSLHCKKIENELELKNYGEASRILSMIEERWGDREPVILLRIRCCAEEGNRSELKNLIEKIEEQGIYLTSEGKAVMEFWKRGGAGL